MATRLSVSIFKILFILSRETTTPPSTGREPPEKPEPAPLGITGNASLLASFKIREISSALFGNTTASGRNFWFVAS